MAGLRSKSVTKNWVISLLICSACWVSSSAVAMDGSCFDPIDYVAKPASKAQRALYIIVDHTMPIDEGMVKRAKQLVSEWGSYGDMVKIAHFSANYRGRYPELVFTQRIEHKPDQAYLFNLRWTDKHNLLNCLESQQKNFHEQFDMHLSKVLGENNPKIPKTDILYSLKMLSRQIIDKDDAEEKHVLLITDGMENSGVTSFYHRGKLRKLNPRKEISKVRRKGMVASWKGANVYIYGLGLTSNNKDYLDPARLEKLRRFWEHYIVEGRGVVKAVGMPELLVTTIQ